MANSVVQDQRKRSLEALERGFAVEHLLRQKKNKKSLNVGDVREPSVRGSFLNGSSTDITNAVVSPSLDGSSEKGKIARFEQIRRRIKKGKEAQD